MSNSDSLHRPTSDLLLEFLTYDDPKMVIYAYDRQIKPWQTKSSGTLLLHLHSKKKGTLQNLKNRFRRRQKACKCVQSFTKRIKRSTEPLKDLTLYPSEDPFFFKTFLSSVDRKIGSVRKYETFRVSH